MCFERYASNCVSGRDTKKCSRAVRRRELGCEMTDKTYEREGTNINICHTELEHNHENIIEVGVDLLLSAANSSLRDLYRAICETVKAKHPTSTLKRVLEDVDAQMHQPGHCNVNTLVNTILEELETEALPTTVSTLKQIIETQTLQNDSEWIRTMWSRHLNTQIEKLLMSGSLSKLVVSHNSNELILGAHELGFGLLVDTYE